MSGVPSDAVEFSTNLTPGPRAFDYPFEGGRWRLRRMRANAWTRSNGYGN